MNAILRRIAVSTTATVALLGGAAATASAAAPEHEATVLAATASAAAPEHEATVLAVAQSSPQDPAGITNAVTSESGSGAAIQNPVDGVQPNGVNPQQLQTQASGAAIGTGVVAILLLGTVVFFRVRSNHLKAGDAVVVTLLGIALAGTVVGTMGSQITGSAISSLGGVLGGL